MTASVFLKSWDRPFVHHDSKIANVFQGKKKNLIMPKTINTTGLRKNSMNRILCYACFQFSA